MSRAAHSTFSPRERVKLLAVTWMGGSFVLVKATGFRSPSLAHPVCTSFTEKPRALTVMHTLTCTNIWRAFSPDQQYLTAWEPTAVHLQNSAVWNYSLPFCSLLWICESLQHRRTQFCCSWTAHRDERCWLNAQLHVLGPQSLHDFTFQVRF